MTNRKLLTIGGGTALLGAVLTGGFISASASDEGSTGSAILTQDSGDTRTTQDADKVARQEAYLAKVAAALGVTVDALKAALTSAGLATVDERLAAGEITAEQAAEMKERIESGDALFGFGGPGGGRGHHGGIGRGLGVPSEELTTFRGIDQATLDAARTAQKSLATIAAEAGKSRDELKAFLTAQAEESVAQAVTDGRLTQAEADEKLSNFETNLDAMIDSTAPGGRGHGPRGGTAPSGTTPNGAGFSYSGMGQQPLF